MYYIISPKHSGAASAFIERSFTDRDEVKRYIIAHENELQRLAVAETGNIFGYAVEKDQHDKATAILIKHRVAQWIWIDIE